jgi:uncharacterized protein YdeI (BOF family)
MKRLSVLVVALSLLGPTVGVVSAQDAAAVRVEGRVIWRAGQKAVIAPDGSPSVNIDLSQVPQDQYGVLKEGDRVVVTGSVPNERNRVIAGSIERLTP